MTGLGCQSNGVIWRKWSNCLISQPYISYNKSPTVQCFSCLNRLDFKCGNSKKARQILFRQIGINLLVRITNDRLHPAILNSCRAQYREKRGTQGLYVVAGFDQRNFEQKSRKCLIFPFCNSGWTIHWSVWSETLLLFCFCISQSWYGKYCANYFFSCCRNKVISW